MILRFALIVGLGCIIGVALYLVLAAFVLLNNVVPLVVLPLLMLIGVVAVVAYDEFGPKVP